MAFIYEPVSALTFNFRVSASNIITLIFWLCVRSGSKFPVSETSSVAEAFVRSRNGILVSAVRDSL